MEIGPYKVIRQIGRGGMGTVYEVRHPEIPRALALKVVRSDVLDEVTRERFRREGEALAAIAHPNVVSVHQLKAFGEQLVLVTEFVEGVSLHDHLHERGPLGPERALEVLRGIASAVSQLHGRGLVHRDLKPDNVLLRQDGTPVVIDFGLARDTQARSDLTRTGEILGTPGFMAPEQARDASRADARSDVYALGAILFACLAGHPPFRGATALETLDRVLHAPPEWPPSASGWPGSLRQLCRQALSKEPDDRPSSAGEFLSALEDESAAPSRRARSVTVAGLLLLGSLALLSALGISLLSEQGQTESLLAPEEAIRLGKAPLPRASLGPEASPELQRWSGVRRVLRGASADPELLRLAEGGTPGAHALGATLAAIRGDRVEVERRLEQQGQVRRVELRLLPSLAEAHQGVISRGDARRVKRFLKSNPELLELAEFLGLQALAAGRGPNAPPAEGALENPELPAWARERLLLSAIRDPLDEASLDRMGRAADWLSSPTKAQLAKRVAAVIRRTAPHQDQERFDRETLRLLTRAIEAHRRLAPDPSQLPLAEDLVKFMLSSGVDMIAGDSAGTTGEDFDFAIALADALPDNPIVQSAAGQSIWNYRWARPDRWRRLLAIAWRELSLVESQEVAATLGARKNKHRVQIRMRIFQLLIGLQESLPQAERDPMALQTARKVALELRDTDPNFHPDSHQIDLLYLRFLEGALSAEEVAKIPEAWVSPRLAVIRFAFMSSREQAIKTSALFSATLSQAREEVTAGILMHRVIADYLWPREGVLTKDPARAVLLIEAATGALQTRNPYLALHWWIQTTRLTLVRSATRAKRRCTTIAKYARRVGLADLADELLEVARAPKDEDLSALAERTRPFSIGGE